MIVRYLFILSLAASLAGCASEPLQVTYYMLAPPETVTETNANKKDRQTLVIENVELTDYLRQSGLALQSGDNKLVVSKSHLWAESLDQAVPRALLRQLQQKSDGFTFYLKSSDYVDQTDYRLKLHIDSLQATDRGEVVTAGRFQLISNVDTAHQVSENFYIRRNLDDDGYAHAVEQMYELVGQIADAILEAMKDMAAGPGSQDTP